MNTVMRRKNRVVTIGLMVMGAALMVGLLLFSGRSPSSSTAVGSYSDSQPASQPALRSEPEQAVSTEVLTVKESATDARRSARQAKRSAQTARAEASSAEDSAQAAKEAAAVAIATVNAARSGDNTSGPDAPTAPSDVVTTIANTESTILTPKPATPTTNPSESDSPDIVTSREVKAPTSSDTKSLTRRAGDSQSVNGASADPVQADDQDKPTSASVATAPAPSKLTNGMKNMSSRGVLDTRGVKAFPGAEGGGQDATGGRGGQLIIVNSLECTSQKGDGKITLKEAWERIGDVSPGPAYIVFSVGGITDCEKNTSRNKSNIVIKDNTTTMCQTAPTPGVNVGSYRTAVGNNNIMVGCRLLNYDTGAESAGPFRNATTTLKHSVIGHMLSGLNTVDDMSLGVVLSGSNGYAHSLTLSDSLIAESDAESSHRGSGNPNRYQVSHGPGCAAGLGVTRKRPVMDCWFIGNVMAQTNRRNPKFWNSSGGVINNMIYNSGAVGAMILQREASEVDIYLTDNYFKHGPTSHKTEAKNLEYRIEVKSDSRLLNRNNKIEYRDGKVITIPKRTDSPKVPLRTFHESMDWTNPRSFDCIGAYHRDGNDQRIINEILNGTGEVGIGSVGDPAKNDGDPGRHWTNTAETKANNYYKASKHPASYDTDNDGMEDAWERANGLTVGTNDFWEDADNDGYANGEEHAHAKARRCVQG